MIQNADHIVQHIVHKYVVVVIAILYTYPHTIHLSIRNMQ